MATLQNRHDIVIDGTLAGVRLDKALSQATGLTRSRVQDLLATGHVISDKGKTVAADYKVKAGDSFTIHVPQAQPARQLAQAIDLDVLFEDNDVIVINKPAGLVVHPGAGNPDKTLVNALLAHCGSSLSGIGGQLRPGIVHRLDKDTSGVMVAAKNDLAHQHLAQQFAAHSITRVYVAVVYGCPKNRQGEITGNIGRDKHNRQKMTVLKNGGRTAKTIYRVLKTNQSFSFVECRLATGRTHQIRVHLTAQGQPLVGDPVYGRGKAPTPEYRAVIKNFHRQALHARDLGFVHPNGNALFFTASPPVDFHTLLVNLGLAP